MLLEIPAKTADEPRFLVIGQTNEKHWSAVITYRGSNIRLVSVRRARTEEVALWMIDSLDREASKLGVTRQSVIKIWLAERLEASTTKLPHQESQGFASALQVTALEPR